jgi:hypothetical protein
MNWYLTDDDETSSWRLQELPDTDVGTAETGPTSGRAYEVFYNQTRVGKARNSWEGFLRPAWRGNNQD